MTVPGVLLPGRTEPLVLGTQPWAGWGPPGAPRHSAVTHRLAFAAAHIVMDASYAATAHAPASPGPREEIAEAIDWTATLALRRRLDRLGFGIAEAMDTAQRFDVGWAVARRLIEMTGAAQLAHGFVAGAGTDHAPGCTRADLGRVVAEQAAVIRAAGGVPVVLPMPQLALERCEPDDYVAVYGEIAERAGGPLLVHWLGPMFLPALEGYFPGDSFERVMALDATIYRGAKLSMLDAALEVRLRRGLLERGQVMLTGDDWNFADLIEGDAAQTSSAPATAADIGPWRVALGDFSHALLGILDGVALPAGRALRHLAAGDLTAYRAIMHACEAVGRVVFEAPVPEYKAGLAFLAWLDGAQPNAMLPNRLDAARSREHLVRVVEAAAAAGVFEHPEVAAARLAAWAAR